MYRHREVISCSDAAKARGIELRSELKTLLLRVQKKIVAVHLRGDRRLDNRRLRRLFGARPSFMRPDELDVYGLRPGTINPWNVPFCDAHVVASSVFSLAEMATNNSRRDEGVLFATGELRALPNVIIGDIDRDMASC
jgi:prolyl-tRNA editing enzyme YbaK/EbsC (Cys-tRNA(Pro) deacylase)